MSVRFSVKAGAEISRQKVQAIKSTRYAFGIGLRDSKNFIEACENETQIVRCTDTQFVRFYEGISKYDFYITIEHMEYIEDEVDSGVHRFDL